ncbi:hypothetical protein ACIO6T_30920 [Streptomyces sp. NPDC087532]|uniref:hypothetical protein n=1 Tax=Streptomyces sp. NPDC087532 TaxID=3365795 RepID=UPI0037F556D5
MTAPSQSSDSKMPPSSSDTNTEDKPGAGVGKLRCMGQGLALPVTARPATGLLLRLGQDDLLGWFDSWHRMVAMLSAAGGSPGLPDRSRPSRWACSCPGSSQ